MKNFRYIWILGLLTTTLIIALPIFMVLYDDDSATQSDPWANVEPHGEAVNHSDLISGPFESAEAVTETCLDCHPDAASEVHGTTHWTWRSDPVQVEGREEPVAIGKANVLNNYCIGVQGNWQGCTACHSGYGWEDESFDFTDESAVDCLVCHDQTGTYTKGTAGYPLEGVDLEAVAQSVGTPSRVNCGSCHFNGGGGNGVKHGDLDESLYFPNENIDVHMGRHNFLCIDCHQADEHEISGRAMSVSLDEENAIACTDCHSENLHDDERINDHTDTVACQTCHIPAGALREPTKVQWDWSTAGQDIAEDPHEYLKIKGSFVYEEEVEPEYYWYNGEADRYLLGDEINPDVVTALNEPHGDINDPEAQIFPFKVHRANQIYDTELNHLLQPKTVGEGGYWSEFDWDLAAELGAEAAGIEYSGNYGFTETEMYWPQTHMVQPTENALQCTACHGEGGRMDWAALGYPGDPLTWGGRDVVQEDDE